jgi:starch-binding outer membrane protein, SusD/RagB family
MRWGTWKESRFFEGAGLKQMWGTLQYDYTWSGDRVYTWPAPWSERQLNPNLKLAGKTVKPFCESAGGCRLGSNR